MGPAKTTVYVAPPSGGPSCRLLEAAFSPVTADVLAGRGPDASLGAGRLLAGSGEPTELASSLALRLPTSFLEGRRGAPAPRPGAVLRLPAGTAGFFFLLERAILTSLRLPGDTCKVEIA
jgi:hypothetical protein